MVAHPWAISFRIGTENGTIQFDDYALGDFVAEILDALLVPIQPFSPSPLTLIRTPKFAHIPRN